MRREVSLEEISDGKRYGSNDMVKVVCDGCNGCSSCCRGMGSSIVLDPYDVHRLSCGLGQTFEELLSDRLELNVVDGIILPNLRMEGEGETCVFLNEAGRCRIHPYRPGICRIFPLGRIYENGSFQYFNQIHECGKEQKSKVKIRKWIDTPDNGKYERFITDWHYFLKDLEEKAKHAGDENVRKRITMYVLQHFYLLPYGDTDDFYSQFKERLSRLNCYNFI